MRQRLKEGATTVLEAWQEQRGREGGNEGRKDRREPIKNRIADAREGEREGKVGRTRKNKRRQEKRSKGKDGRSSWEKIKKEEDRTGSKNDSPHGRAGGSVFLAAGAECASFRLGDR